MLFSSLLFLQIFLPLLLLCYFCFPGKICVKNALLLTASLLFYSWGEPEKIIVLLVSILANWFLAYFGLRFELDDKIRRAALALGIVLNLAVLVAFKYTIPVFLFLDDWVHWPMHLSGGALPLGISFYTFQIISYLIDTYRKQNKPQGNLLKLSLYVAFFPQLVAGPIIKYHDIAHEIDDRRVDSQDFAIGLRLLIIGLSKKVLLANTFAVVADDIFSMPFARMDTLVAWVGAICYTLQIYFDFSGYSDMAIGLGRMFGFHFPENFNFPYCATSIREFWRRWHISLSTWFKEYLYIPLGGNRCSKYRWSCNIMIVFLATGIWHGAALNFVFWGVFYGLLIVAENLLWGRALEKKAWKPVSYCYTMFVVIMAWVVFRADSLGEAWQYWGRMLTLSSNPDLHLADFFASPFLAVLAVGIFFAAPFPKLFPGIVRHLRTGLIELWEIPILIVLLAAVLVQLSGNTYNPFIYFRF